MLQNRKVVTLKLHDIMNAWQGNVIFEGKYQCEHMSLQVDVNLENTNNNNNTLFQTNMSI